MKDASETHASATQMVEHLTFVERLRKPLTTSSLRLIKWKSGRFLVSIGLVVISAIFISSGCRWAWVSWQIHAAKQQLVIGHVDVALEMLQSALPVQPNRAELLFMLGRAYRRTGNMDEAISCLGKAFVAGWSAEEIRQQRYLVAIQSGRFDEAGPFLDEVLHRNTDDDLAYEVYEAIAKGHLSAYRFRDAMLCLDHFVAWKPDAVEPRLWRAEIYKRMHKWQEAHDEYAVIISAHPDTLEPRRSLAACLIELQRGTEALEQYQKCLGLAPDDIESQLGLAKVYWMQGNTAEAERRYAAILKRELPPENRVEVLSGLAQAANLEKQYDRAAGYVEEILQVFPFDAPANHLLGTIYMKQGRDEEAVKLLEKARDYTKQISRFGEILQELYEHPEDADLRWEAGSILMSHGDERNGAAWMATALLFDPHHRKTLDALSEHYTRTKDTVSTRSNRETADKL